ncbi:MAG: hypothetical protein PVH61_26640 [Candidatus Aminicenantes bacterium]
MRLINKNDEEMLNAIKLSIKITGKDKMAGHFKKEIETGKNPADAWFYYGLNAWEMMNSTSHSNKKHEYLVESLKGFGEACIIDKNHWPAIFLRSLISILMSGNDVDEMTAYLLPGDYTSDEAYTDLEKLLELQINIKAEPYFFVPYACIAKKMLEMNDMQKAKKYISEGLVRTPAGKVNYFDFFLKIPVILLFNKLLGLKQLKLALKVKNRFDILFPGNKIK